MKEFRLEVKVKNNLLIKRREDAGLTLQQIAEGADLSMNTYYGYEALRIDAWSNRKQDWKPSALKISTFWNVNPLELWPDAVRLIEMNKGSFELGSAEAELLVSSYSRRSVALPNELLESVESTRILGEMIEDTLDPRQKQVLDLLFGLEGEPCTLQEVGDQLGVSRERARQIECKAMCILRRHPSSKQLRNYDDSEFLINQWKKEQQV